MTMIKEQPAINISTSAILFSALIGIGFCITLVALGAAVISCTSEINIPSHGIVLVLSISLSAAMLTMAFFIAGYIASRLSHQQFCFDSIIHSLGTWAVMAILLVVLVSTATIGDSVRRNLNEIKAPIIVTDLHFFKGKAVTSLQEPHGHNKHEEEPPPEDKKADQLLALAWWISCLSLTLGSGASVVGGLLGRQKLAKKSIYES